MTGLGESAVNPLSHAAKTTPVCKDVRFYLEWQTDKERSASALVGAMKDTWVPHTGEESGEQDILLETEDKVSIRRQ